MKNKGISLIEIVVSITIFLIAILPVVYLTQNSLVSIKKTSEIEESSKVTTTVINYIKSRGYNDLDIIIDGDTSFANGFSNTYSIIFDNFEDAYVFDNNDSTSDFELDFFGTSFYDPTTQEPDALFVLDNLGIDLNGSTVTVSMKKQNLHLIFNGSYETDYINPINDTSTNIIVGENGIITDKTIFGKVSLSYTSKAKSGEQNLGKIYEQHFSVSPIENYKK